MDERSERNLAGVHPDLVRLIRAAHLPYSIIITEGMRTPERQAELVGKGLSKTHNSRHLTGHAVDFAVQINGKTTWEWAKYAEVGKAIKAEGQRLGILVEWGGDWAGFRDGTHVQLPWSVYPINAEKQKTEATSKTVATASVAVPVAAYLDVILERVKGAVDSVDGVGGDYITWIKIAAVVAVAGWLIYDRISKIRREGI